MTCLRCQRDVAPRRSFCPACGAPAASSDSGPSWTHAPAGSHPVRTEDCRRLRRHRRLPGRGRDARPGSLARALDRPGRHRRRRSSPTCWRGSSCPRDRPTRSTVGRRLVAFGHRREDRRRLRRSRRLLRRRRDTGPGAVDRAVGAARAHRRRAARLCRRLVDRAEGADERLAAAAARRVAPPQFEHR